MIYIISELDCEGIEYSEVLGVYESEDYLDLQALAKRWYDENVQAFLPQRPKIPGLETGPVDAHLTPIEWLKERAIQEAKVSVNGSLTKGFVSFLVEKFKLVKIEAEFVTPESSFCRGWK